MHPLPSDLLGLPAGSPDLLSNVVLLYVDSWLQETEGRDERMIAQDAFIS
jgi:hypothetical protein